MGKRPILQLELSKFDYVLEILALGGLIVLWGIIAYSYQSLPEQIPMHYNLSGEVDRMGGKYEIFWLATIVTVIYAGLTILNKYPHRFNYLVEITPENALQQYTIGTRTIRFLKAAMMVIFIAIVCGMVNS